VGEDHGQDLVLTKGHGLVHDGEGQGLGKEIVRERRNVRGKERKNVKKRGKGENGVYLLLRRIICVCAVPRFG
jgi:hypothetical protein